MSGRDDALSPPGALTGKSQFDEVFAAKQSTASRHFRAHVKLLAQGPARLGMAIGRRIDKRAVIRNRLRRQVRESLRRQPLRTAALAVVITARPTAAQLSRDEAWADLQLLWQRLAERLDHVPQVAADEARQPRRAPPPTARIERAGANRDN